MQAPELLKEIYSGLTFFVYMNSVGVASYDPHFDTSAAVNYSQAQRAPPGEPHGVTQSQYAGTRPTGTDFSEWTLNRATTAAGTSKQTASANQAP